MAAMTASKVALPPLIPSTHLTTANPHPHSLSKPLSPITKTTSRPPLSDAQRWHHLSSRTPATTPFIYAVLTTKIYCLPTCPSRLARRANVVFFSAPQEAEREGFRACKRCKPDLSPSFIPARATEQAKSNASLAYDTATQTTTNTNATDNDKTITTPTTSATSTSEVPEFDPTDPSLKLHLAIALVKAKSQSGEKISLAQLAQEVELSKWHLQRAFKRRCGRSPREMGEELIKEREKREGGEPSGSADGSRAQVAAGRAKWDVNDAEAGFGDEWADAGASMRADELPSLLTLSRLAPDHVRSTNMDMEMPLDPNLDLWNLNTEWETEYKLANSPQALQPGKGFTTPTGSSLPAFSATSDRLTESRSSYATTPAPLPDFSPMMMDGDTAFNYDSNFYPEGFSPDVEGVLRDLFPEIYDGNMMDRQGKLI